MTAAAIGTLGAGSALGRYELLLPVAQGGMATVWAARMKGTRGFAKIVAIKTMLPALSTDSRFEKMFLSEAEIASRIKHPNVCEILDLGEQDGVLYLVMEWIDGESLVTLLSDCQRQERRVPYGVAARLGINAARGLHAAHELKDDAGELFGVVHRDVSPHNILVTHDGIVKIVDFGVAKAVARSDHQATNTGHLKGKVQFMAPEQAFCDEVVRRTDVFALGIVLYQITTGAHPFRADNELATLARITSAEPVPAPTTLVPDYPKELSLVVERALAKERDERFATMSDLARALEVALAAIEKPDDPTLEAFVKDVLRERLEGRSTAIKDALRAADERTLTGISALTRDSRSHSSFSEMAGLDEGAAMSPRGRRGRSIVFAAGLVALGAVLGAAGLVWVTRAPQGPAPSLAASPSPVLPDALATATASAPSAPASATATPTASAATTASAAVKKVLKPLSSTAPSASGTGLNPNFRKPDF